nr:MAG TPA: hypothetical protein [Caudoviricetes sp.]
MNERIRKQHIYRICRCYLIYPQMQELCRFYIKFFLSFFKNRTNFFKLVIFILNLQTFAPVYNIYLLGKFMIAFFRECVNI